MPKKRKPAETFDEHLAAVVASRMEKRSRRQEDVAEATQIPLSNFGRRMRGLVPFTADEIVRVATYLQFDPADMLQEALDDMGGYRSLLSEVRGNKGPSSDDDLSNVTVLSRPQSEAVSTARKAAHREPKDQE
jgi:hypothetical protein